MSLPTLLRESLRLCARNIVPFSLAVLGCAAIAAALTLTQQQNLAANVANYVLLPLLTTVVYAFAGASTETPRISPWLLALERAWAVLIIDFIVGFFQSNAFAVAVDGHFFDELLGVGTLLISAPLLLADVDAVLSTDESIWFLVPLALLKSLRIGMRPHVFARVAALLVLEIAIQGFTIWLHPQLNARHIPHLTLIADFLPTLLCVPFLGSLTLLIYREACVVEPPAA